MSKQQYTARFTAIPSGMMGQLVEWPEVITEGKDIADCREMLADALREMVLAYQEMGKAIPEPRDPAVYEPISVRA